VQFVRASVTRFSQLENEAEPPGRCEVSVGVGLPLSRKHMIGTKTLDDICMAWLNRNASAVQGNGDNHKFVVKDVFGDLGNRREC
jgi:hypothetical protein